MQDSTLELVQDIHRANNESMFVNKFRIDLNKFDVEQDEINLYDEKFAYIKLALVDKYLDQNAKRKRRTTALNSKF